MTLEIHYGGAVSGERRFPRPELEKRFLRTLASSAGIKMFGLRRTGKSTMRERALEELRTTGRPHVFIDGQGLHSLGDFLSRLAAVTRDEPAILDRALGLLAGPAAKAVSALRDGERFEEAALSAYWQQVSNAIRESLKEGRAPVLVVDEFSYLVQNMVNRGRVEDVDLLLAGMREWRDGGMTMLLTGSLGLTALARTAGFNLEHLNDLQPFSIPELDEVEAREFVDQATAQPSGGAWTDEHTDEFLVQTGVFYPCFLVRGLMEIGPEEPLDPDRFADVFADRVRPDLHADFYAQFDKRFGVYATVPDRDWHALILPALEIVMTSDAPVPQERMPLPEDCTQVDLSFALRMLVEDGFLTFSENADGDRFWKPASRLARTWWRRARLA